MKHSKLNAALLMSLIAFSAAALAGSEENGGPEGGHDLSWFSIDGGGTTFSTGGGYELGGTIGQPDAGALLIGGSYSLSGGFWPGTSAEPVDPCPPDITGDLIVNVDDLLAVIGDWGAPGGPADVTADGIVNVDDLLVVIGAWGACS
jgi:hypothetical protein